MGGGDQVYGGPASRMGATSDQLKAWDPKADATSNEAKPPEKRMSISQRYAESDQRQGVAFLRFADDHPENAERLQAMAIASGGTVEGDAVRIDLGVRPTYVGATSDRKPADALHEDDLIVKLRQDLADAEKREAHLLDWNDQLKKQAEAAEESAKAGAWSEAERERLEGELASTVKAWEQRGSDLDAARATIERQTTSLEEVNAWVRRQDETISQLRTEAGKWQSDNLKLQQEAGDHRKTIDNLRSDLANKAQEEADLRRELETAKELRETIARQDAVIAEQRAALAASPGVEGDERLAMQNRHAVTLSTMQAEHRKAMSEIQAQLAVSLSARDTLAERLGAAQRALSNEGKWSEASEAELQALRATNSDLRAALAKLESETAEQLRRNLRVFDDAMDHDRVDDATIEVQAARYRDLEAAVVSIAERLNASDAEAFNGELPMALVFIEGWLKGNGR